MVLWCRSADDDASQLYNTNDVLRFESMSSARVGLAMCIVSARLSIACFLCYTGSMFLVYTTSMEDLLLNALALEFVMSLDELFFEALAPDQLRDVMGAIAPLRIPRRARWEGGDVRAATLPVVIAVLMLVTSVTQLSPAVGNLRGI